MVCTRKRESAGRECGSGRVHATSGRDRPDLGARSTLSVWPLEGGRYGIDAHYQGATGIERAEAQAQRLSDTGLRASRRTDEEGSLVRLGPLTRDSVWIALEAFLGRRMV